jgi:phage baseplate assembly protein W
VASTGFAFLGLSRMQTPALGALAGAGPAVFGDRPAMVSGDAAVRQAILMLLSTRPGERVMRPDYGCPVHRLIFSPNDATTAGLAIHYVRQALLRFEPRIDIIRIDAGPRPDAERATLVIVLEYRVRDTLRAERLTLELDLQGEQP